MNSSADESEIFTDIDYICDSHSLITNALKKGCDIAQLPTGEIIVTETKITNTEYRWNPDTKKMTKVRNPNI